MRKQKNLPSKDTLFNLQELFEPPLRYVTDQAIESSQFRREYFDFSGNATLVLDSFPDSGGISCCFVRIASGKTRSVVFVVQGSYRIESCQSGGWILEPDNSTLPCYWLPQPPLGRQYDSQQRILSEQKVSIGGFNISTEELSVKIEIPEDIDLDCTIWKFPAGDHRISGTFDQLHVLETQPLSLWNSQTRYQSPADIYLYLIHGNVYVDRFIWPRMWKICSELDAYGLYVAVSGLELATGKLIYTLLKRQLLFSVVTRQAEDGGWYHGEWTDLMESHYRFHNGAILLLEAALKEHPDEVVSNALKKGTQFISRYTDNTDLGLWFLHDSLEQSEDMMKELCKQINSPWIPDRTLGKSTTNKLILNTHLDTIIVLQQYSSITGDNRYADKISSACAAARNMLALRPAEFLYRLAYRAINLTLLPKQEAQKLPFFTRAFKRLTWKYLIPQMYRLKQVYPRLVMPGGLIERHLGMPHYDINYHPVNIMDLARFWRCFPDEDLGEIIENAVNVVTNNNILEYWAESKPRHFSLVVWVEAIYHLCTLKKNTSYRRTLAEGIILILDNELGLPPALLGAEAEAVKISDRVACPSPADCKLRVANLSSNGSKELLVINPTDNDRELVWEGDNELRLTWMTADNQPLTARASSFAIPSRQWIWGQQK